MGVGVGIPVTLLSLLAVEITIHVANSFVNAHYHHHY